MPQVGDKLKYYHGDGDISFHGDATSHEAVAEAVSEDGKEVTLLGIVHPELNVVTIRIKGVPSKQARGNRKGHYWHTK